MKNYPVLLFFLMIMPLRLQAQPIRMVADLNTSLKAARVGNLLVSKDRLFFTANDGIQGMALWTYDEVSPPRIIYSFGRPGSSYYYQEFTLWSDKLYFLIGGENYHNIWIYDGKNRPVTAESYFGLPFPDDPTELKVFDDRLFFKAIDTIKRRMCLWVFDGTGTPAIVEEKYKGFTGEGLLDILTYFNNQLYLTAGLNGLWVYNGADSLKKVVDSKFYRAWNFVEANGKLYFQATDLMNHGYQVWEFDGANAPRIVSDSSVYHFNEFKEIIWVNNKVFYVNTDEEKLYNFDCETEALNKFANLKDPYGLKGFENKLFFIAASYPGKYDLWEYDGINPVKRHLTITRDHDLDYKTRIFVMNEDLFAMPKQGELWLYDRDSGLFKKTGDFLENFGTNHVAFNNKDYFVFSDDLWAFDGDNFPARINGINKCNWGSEPSGLFVRNDTLYFQIDICSSCNYNSFCSSCCYAYDGVNPPRPGVTDYYSSYDNFKKKPDAYEFNNIIYFKGGCGRTLCSLEAYNGDSISHLLDYAFASSNFAAFKDLVYVGVDYHLMCVEGMNKPSIAARTQEIVFGSTPYNLIAFENRLYFAAKDSGEVNFLWTYDGITTPEKVWQVKYPYNFIVFRDKLYFSDGGELWKLDGQGHPSLVIQTCQGASCPTISQFMIYGDRLYFTASDGVHGVELWRLEEGKPPVMVSDIYKGMQGSAIHGMQLFNNNLFFVANDGVHGAELWKYNGVDQPVLLGDIYSGKTSSSPAELTIYKNKLYFSATDYLHGRELFEYCPCCSADTVSACETYVSPSGKYIWDTSGTYSDTIPGASGCDSIITLNLTIHHSSIKTLNESSCAEYNFNGRILKTSGTYAYRTTNAAGCDSIVVLYLTILKPTSGILNITACDQFVFEDKILTETGVYLDTVPNSVGCDSLITLNLVIIKSSTSTIYAEACNTYTSPSGDYSWTSSGIYTDTIPNAAGCDSVITINLTIINSSTSTISPLACESYISPSGKIWATSGEYKDTIPNAAGCDSIITVNLTIGRSTSFMQQSACDSYTSPSGRYTWTSSGTYLDTIPNAAGCDSLITIDLQVDHVDTTVLQDRTVLISNDRNAAHQWIDCGNGKALIEGETYLTFTSTASGSYAVIVSNGACVDTSSCYAITVTGITELSDNNITLYPNPTNGSFTIDLGRVCREAVVTITAPDGQVIHRENVRNTHSVELDLAAPPGLYMVTVTAEKESAVFKVVKND